MSESLVAYLWYYAALVAIVRPAMVAAILLGLWIALRRTRLSADAQLRTWLAVALPLVAWLAVIWSVAISGAFQVRLLLPLALVLPVATGLVLLMRSERIAEAADAASPAWIIGLQVYRVIGGNFVVLWALGGAIPGAFAIPAGFGDMLVGA